MIIYDSKGKKKNVVLQAYYNLDGDYILFEDNPLHGKRYKNVGVVVTTQFIRLTHMDIAVNVIRIEGQEPIECEFIGCIENGNDLIIKICQDWG